MLLRMYLRWAERHGYEVELLDRLDGEEAGIKSATIALRGDYAYGYLRGENGVHRLVRISPYDAAKRRHTSFASVYVYPEIDDDVEIDIVDKDLRVDTYRSSGAGGQHVNVTDSAIRITHLPTNIVVTCQNERSQHKNRATAMRILRSRLYDLEMKKRADEQAAREGEKREIGFGSQIRSYVLHPYRMVKDHRTSTEVGDSDRVLDGDIDPFIEAFLRSQMEGAQAKAAAKVSRSGRAVTAAGTEGDPAPDRRRRDLSLDLVSPLPPVRTGIADYTVDLLPELEPLCDLRVVRVDGQEVAPEIVERWHPVAMERLGEGGRVPFYQMGNNLHHERILEIGARAAGPAHAPRRLPPSPAGRAHAGARGDRALSRVAHLRSRTRGRRGGRAATLGRLRHARACSRCPAIAGWRRVSAASWSTASGRAPACSKRCPTSRCAWCRCRCRCRPRSSPAVAAKRSGAWASRRPRPSSARSASRRRSSAPTR